MTTYTGDDGVITVATNAIAELTSFDLDESSDLIEDTAMGDTNKTHKAGKANVSGSITAFYDSSDTAQAALTNGSDVALELRPRGTGSGKPKWNVTGTIQGLQTSVGLNEIITVTFNWSAAGALTKATQ